MDDTQIIKALMPKDDGEVPMRHRTAIVSALGTDGTVTLTMGTSSVAARILEGVVVAVGDLVQVAAWAGDLLVLGRVRASVSQDASTESATFTNTTPHTFTHTPVDTPRGILVLIDHGAVSTDLITSVSYGGVAMSRVASIADTAGEPGRVYAYFLGANVPVGAQTVSIVHSGSADVKHAVAISIVGPSNLSCSGVGETSGDQANPQISVGSDSAALRYAVIYSGLDSVASLTPLAGMTAIHDHDYGAYVSRVDRQTSPTSGAWTIGYTAASDDVAMVAVAISQASASVRSVVFTAVDTISIDNFFTTGNYRGVIAVPTTSTPLALNVRLRAAGVDSTGNVYDLERQYGVDATGYTSRLGSQSSWSVVVGARAKHLMNMELMNPGVADQTIVLLRSVSTPTPMDATSGVMNIGMLHQTASAYDGLTVFASTGYMTGSIHLYREVEL